MSDRAFVFEPYLKHNHKYITNVLKNTDYMLKHNYECIHIYCHECLLGWKDCNGNRICMINKCSVNELRDLIEEARDVLLGGIEEVNL